MSDFFHSASTASGDDSREGEVRARPTSPSVVPRVRKDKKGKTPSDPRKDKKKDGAKKDGAKTDGAKKKRVTPKTSSGSVDVDSTSSGLRIGDTSHDSRDGRSSVDELSNSMSSGLHVGSSSRRDGSKSSGDERVSPGREEDKSASGGSPKKKKDKKKEKKKKECDLMAEVAVPRNVTEWHEMEKRHEQLKVDNARRSRIRMEVFSEVAMEHQAREAKQSPEDIRREYAEATAQLTGLGLFERNDKERDRRDAEWESGILKRIEDQRELDRRNKDARRAKGSKPNIEGSL